MKTGNNIVYNVCFNPKRPFVLASCYSNGGIDIWDVRKPSLPLHNINGHISNTVSLDWHPDIADLLISAADKFIKIWNLKDLISNSST